MLQKRDKIIIGFGIIIIFGLCGCSSQPIQNFLHPSDQQIQEMNEVGQRAQAEAATPPSLPSNTLCGLPSMSPLGCSATSMQCVCDQNNRCQWLFSGCQ